MPLASLAALLRQAGHALQDLVYPPRCLVCHKPGIWLCDACCRDFPLVSPPVCPLCGDPTRAAGLCGRCRRTPPAIDGMRSVVLFEREAREAVHLLKYGNRPVLAEPLARLMADYWRANPIPVDLVTAVPLHPARQRERGYNQADLLARAFGRMIDVPVGLAVLKRVRHTRPQVSLNAAQRRENMQSAFAAATPAQFSKRQGGDSLVVSGRRVLVIDDVRTTGSTLEACSLALKAAGASSVWGFTLARAPYAAASGDEGQSVHQNLDDKIPA